MVPLVIANKNLSFLLPADATSYAHHVFKAFDVSSCGAISFKVWY